MCQINQSSTNQPVKTSSVASSVNSSLRQASPSSAQFTPKKPEFDIFIMEKLVKLGHDRKLFAGIPLSALFIPVKDCHLEVERDYKGRPISIASVKNHPLECNDGTFHTTKKQHGLRIELYNNTAIESMSYWKNGKQNGISTFYYKNGSIESTVNFVNSKRHGIRSTWEKTGEPLPQTFWIMDKEVSEVDYYKKITTSKSRTYKTPDKQSTPLEESTPLLIVSTHF